MTETQRKYKATFILDTRDYEQPVETLVASITEQVTKLGATVGDAQRNLGRQEFIYVTDKRHTGDIYVQFEFDGGADVPAAVHEHFRLDGTVKLILIESR
jgi:ribosomal protein S6